MGLDWKKAAWTDGADGEGGGERGRKEEKEKARLRPADLKIRS